MVLADQEEEEPAWEQDSKVPDDLGHTRRSQAPVWEDLGCWASVPALLPPWPVALASHFTFWALSVLVHLEDWDQRSRVTGAVRVA